LAGKSKIEEALLTSNVGTLKTDLSIAEVPPILSISFETADNLAVVVMVLSQFRRRCQIAILMK